MGISIDDLLGHSRKKRGTYYGPTKFAGEWVGQDNTPTDFINGVMAGNEATGFSSILEIGFPGTGKTTLAEMVAHHIHMKQPEFTVLWAGANQLRDIEKFLNGLPKTPHIVIFDDASNALKSIDKKKAAKVFEILTQGRHITQSKLIIITIIHYTNAMEKAVRAQNIFYLYTSTSMAEDTNIKALIEHDKHANKNYARFKKAFISLFKHKKFELKVGRGNWKTFERDKPFRVGYSIDVEAGKVFVFTKMNCAKCAQTRSIKKIHPTQIVKRMQQYEKRAGVQALAIQCALRGRFDVFPRPLRAALEFLNRMFEEYDTDFDELTDETVKARHKAHPRFKRDKKKDDEFYDMLTDDSFEETKAAPSVQSPTEKRVFEGFNILFNK